MLIVETGSGLPDADSYASIEQADAQNAALGVADWASLADDAKEIALRRPALILQKENKW